MNNDFVRFYASSKKAKCRDMRGLRQLACVTLALVLLPAQGLLVGIARADASIQVVENCHKGIYPFAQSIPTVWCNAEPDCLQLNLLRTRFILLPAGEGP